MRTKVHYVRQGSPSLKTVIPQAVAEALKLAKGDYLEWEILPDKRIIFAKVTKAEVRR